MSDSHVTRRLRGPAGVGVLALVCAALVLVLTSHNPLRAVAGILIVLFLPGVSLIAALAPSKLPSGLERLALQVGLSIAVTIVTTVAMYALHIRLDLHSWGITLTAITLLGCGAWALRSRPTVVSTGAATRLALRPTRAWIFVGIVGLLITASVMLTLQSVRRTDAGIKFTQLWIRPRVSGPTSALMGIYNHEGHAQRYSIEVSRGGHDLFTTAVDVRDRTTWSRLQAVSPGSGKLRVTIQRGSSAGQPYRQVYVSLPASQSLRRPASARKRSRSITRRDRRPHSSRASAQ